MIPKLSVTTVWDLRGAARSNARWAGVGPARQPAGRVATRPRQHARPVLFGQHHIEANGQASDVTKRPSGGYARQSGYVTVKGSRVEIVFTSVLADPANPATYSPDHFYCTIQSAQAMSCSNTDSAGSTSNSFAVVRVGDPPRGK